MKLVNKILFSLLFLLILPLSVLAANFEGLNLNLSNNKPGEQSSHAFSFTTTTGGNFEEIQFEYCTTPDGGCIAPSGLDLTSSSFDFTTATGIVGQDWNLKSASESANKLIMQEGYGGETLPAYSQIGVKFDGITNSLIDSCDPVNTNSDTCFVRVKTCSDLGCDVGEVLDEGVVSYNLEGQDPGDIIDPAVNITYPSNGETVNGSIGVGGTASDNEGIEKIELYVDDSLVETVNFFFFDYTLDTTNYTDGVHVLKLVAYDLSGNTSEDEISINIDNPDITAPVVNITSPTEEGNVTGDVLVAATASDDEAIDRVELYVGDNFSPYATASAEPYEMTWYSEGFADGDYALTVKAYDQAGNEAFDSVIVSKYTPDTTNPLVYIWSPIEYENVVGTINVEVEATDNIEMDRVELYLDDLNNMIGVQTGTGPNYTFNWDSMTATESAHYLIARAYDTSGNIGNYAAYISVVYPDYENPDVWIVSPSEGQTVSGIINFEADGTDNTELVEVEFFINDQSLGIDFVDPRSVSIDTTEYPDGDYVLKVVGRDAFYNSDEAQINITIDNIDDIAPVVNLNNPSEGSVLEGQVIVEAAASDDKAIDRVEFFINDQLLGTDSSDPYSANLDTLSYTDGSYVVKAVAYDQAGNSNEDQINVSIDNPDIVAPVVSLDSPTDGSTVEGEVLVTATASDDEAMDRVELFIGNDSLSYATDSASPYEVIWYSDGFPDGDYTLTIKAYDHEGNSASDQVIVTSNNVDDVAPAVSLTNPSEGSVLSQVVDVDVEASDDETMDRVEFYLNDELLYSDSFAPYFVSLNTEAYENGNYVLKAIAYDQAGNSSEDSVNVSIENIIADTEAPEVIITSPVNGGTVPRKSNVNIVASAFDNIEVAKVDFYLNGNLICSETSNYTCSFYTGPRKKVVYEITAVATDTSGNTDTDVISVTVK